MIYYHSTAFLCSGPNLNSPQSGENDYVDPTLGVSDITLNSRRPSADVTLTANVDNVVEGNETFRLEISTTTTLPAGNFLQRTLTVTINDTTGTCRLMRSVD